MRGVVMVLAATRAKDVETVLRLGVRFRHRDSALTGRGRSAISQSRSRNRHGLATMNQAMADFLLFLARIVRYEVTRSRVRSRPIEWNLDHGDK